jgi:hypothetical protein
MFLGSKARLVRVADNLTAIYEPISRQSGSLNMPEPYRPVTGIALLLRKMVRGVGFWTTKPIAPQTGASGTASSCDAKNGALVPI